MKLCVAILFLALGVIFANAPPPMPPQLHLNLTQGGQPYAGEANVTYVCSQNSSDVSLICLNGTCTNAQAYDYPRTWYYPGDPCFYSKGRLRVQAAGKSLVTGEISLERAGEYVFGLDLASGNLTASASNPQPGPEEQPGCCPSVLLVFVPVLAFAAKR